MEAQIGELYVSIHSSIVWGEWEVVNGCRNCPWITRRHVRGTLDFEGIGGNTDHHRECRGERLGEEVRPP